MRYSILLLSVLVLLVGLQAHSYAQRDEENPTVVGKKATEWMEILRTSDTVRTRRAALIALRLCGPKTRNIFAEISKAMLNDKEKVVRAEAAQMLSRVCIAARELSDKLPITIALKALVDTVKNDQETEVRAAAAMALGRIGELPVENRDDEINTELRKAIPVLAKALSDPTPATRAAMAESLGRMGELSKGAIKEIIAAVKESKSTEMQNARLFSLYAIRRIGKPEQLQAVDPLLEVMKEKDLKPEMRRHLADTLGSMGEGASSASDALAGYLSDKSVEVRRAAAQALDQIGRGAKGALPQMLEALSNQREDRFVRCNAIHGVARIAPNMDDDAERKKVIAALQRSVSDSISDVRLAAVQALGSMGPEPMGEQLKQVLAKLALATRDLQPAIRNAAKDAIDRLSKK